VSEGPVDPDEWADTVDVRDLLRDLNEDDDPDDDDSGDDGYDDPGAGDGV
jgi:hypothetical protein